MSIFTKKSTLFLLIFLLELISLLGYVFPDLRQVVFLVVVLLFFIISLKNLKAGVLILLIELFIGSKGYLFYFGYNGLIISVRIAFWLIILSAWLAKSLNNFLKIKTCPLKPIIKMQNFSYLSVLFLFVGWGIINGVLQGNNFSNIFFDFNNWLYFALILPIFSTIKTKEDLKLVWQVFLVSVVWLSFKTFILLFFFSHNIPGTIEMLYKWVRTTGVGEITLIQGGFYRIFFQSHIYNLIAFFAFLILTTDKIFKKAKNGLLISYFLFLISLSVVLLSFSRSFWAGLIVGLICYAIIVLWKYNLKLLAKMVGLIILSGILSLALITAVVKFPYPNPLGGFSTAGLLSSRATQISGEAAVSSRWNLLPELWTEIKKAPILGKGLGTTVTYKSNDPRIVKSTADSKLTTYAFEWGWMDIWLKFGIFGFLAYLILILKLLFDSFKDLKENHNKKINSILIISLISICAVHFFTPYLNHPLGVGIIIISLTTTNIYRREGR